MRVELFDFSLPLERIATEPASPRDAARLLHVTAAALADLTVMALPDLLQPGDLMVFNDTKVIPARLRGRRREVPVEILLHKALGADRWSVFARPAKRLKPGDDIVFGPDFSARVEEKTADGQVTLHFALPPGQPLLPLLIRYGEMPLPPYIARPEGARASDTENYQTLYARHEGAVAAPTAGLHFTERLIDAIRSRQVGMAFVTLHVGGGTFLPVKAEDTKDHVMHSEWGQVSEETAARINDCKKAGGRILAVGTTSLRLLESATGEDGIIRPYTGETDIFITPGYRFKLVDRLMTNFHLPRSTLFMLVSAFSGLTRMQEAYQHAIASGYRFYSYGDACLLERCEASA